MTDKMTVKKLIEEGKAVLGMELGSTRIKAVLLDEHSETIATGTYDWENQLVDGVWTYSLDKVHEGIRACYSSLVNQVKETYGVPIKRLAAIGVSGMMHGYLAFDREDKLLVPFRTWRNTMTDEASEALTELLDFHVPQRWSIAHLYQAMLNREAHVKDINFMTTLSGYVHWLLTGEKVLGIGDASGMFPIDSDTMTYDVSMMVAFDQVAKEFDGAVQIGEILPKVLVAGDSAGALTEKGAALLDPSGELEVGIPLCPPEGDAGTGMVATNSVRKRTGNVSAGTSVFAMIVLEKALSKAYPEIDMVTTPSGAQVAMVHCNNCTSDLNAWVMLFKEFAESAGMTISMDDLYGTLYRKGLEGDPDGGGLLAYNYFSGEHITGFEEGRPLFVRRPDSNFNLANFMKVHLYTAIGALKIGMDLIMEKEGVKLDRILGHGGFFKTEGVGQTIMASGLNTPVSVMATAGEGGAWGIAVLAAFLKEGGQMTFEDYLDQKVFEDTEMTTIDPEPMQVKGFDTFIETYKAGLSIERAAIEHLN